MDIQSIGIIGYGDFGRFIQSVFRKYFPNVDVKVFSRKKETDEETFFSLDDVCQTDLLFPCVPIKFFEEIIEKIVPRLWKNTIILDVCTVKMHPLAVLQKQEGVHYVCTHPMFGPYSYAKIGDKLDGLRMVVAEHNIEKEKYDQLLQVLQKLKLNVVEMSSDTHDQMLAETLFLTHYLTQTIVAADFHRTDIDTVSFGFLMDAVESVKNDTELFKDVYRFNPHCKKTIRKLQEAAIQVAKMIDTI